MVTLTNDDLMVTARLLGIQTLPMVLGVHAQQESYEDFRQAQEDSLKGLRTSGLVDEYDEVRDDLAQALITLSQPERELVARRHTSEGVHRICLARRGAEHALAIFRGEDYQISTIWADGQGNSLAKPLLGALGTAEAAQIPTFTAEVDQIRDKLDAARAASDFTQIAYTAGIPEDEAISYGLAMSTCHGHTEIVAYAHEDGTITRAPGAVALYDTARGRIAAAPTHSPDGTAWTTWTPATPHRIAQALTNLVESLPGGRWLP